LIFRTETARALGWAVKEMETFGITKQRNYIGKVSDYKEIGFNMLTEYRKRLSN
jgi:hypothetical protein